jgi:hypothetical protein
MKARAQRLNSIYRPGCITPAWLRELAQLSRFEQGPHFARVMLAEAGIKLVIEPHFKKTYLDGAAMLDRCEPSWNSGARRRTPVGLYDSKPRVSWRISSSELSFVSLTEPENPSNCPRSIISTHGSV